MGYATLSQAREWISPGYGQCSVPALNKAVNKIRQHMYAWYESLPLFLDAIECFAVQRFDAQCNGCQDSFRGVTLPRDFQTVEAMWWNDWPVELQSSWREFQVGMSNECDCHLEKFDVPGAFCTAVDLCPSNPQRLVVVALDRADEGKKFTIRGTNAAMRQYVEGFTLSTKPQQTTDAIRMIDRRGGITKDPTAGRVVLQEPTGRVLGIYEPDETVPTYKRIKIAGLPDDCQVVNIRAARRYMPVFGDNDVVETDQEIAWDAMARFLRIFERADATEGDAGRARSYASAAKALVMGQQSREMGKGTQTQLTIKTPRLLGSNGGLNRTSRLGGYRL